MRIVTTYKTNGNGRSQVVAKANGRQKTTSWDHSKSTDRNHGEAAANLVLANAERALTEWQVSREAVMNATHEMNDSGTVHTFVL